MHRQDAKHWNWVVSFGLMLILLALSACGGASTTNQVEEPAAVAPTAEAVEPTEEAAPAAVEAAPTDVVEPTTESAPAEDAMPELTLWVIGEQRVPALNQLGEKFKEEYGVGLTVEVVDLAEIRNQLLLGAGTGEGPDMAIIPHDNIGPLAENGVLAEIDLGDTVNEFLPNAIAGLTYDGVLVGVPVAVENIGFFRNAEMVPDAPTTWEEVYTIGKDMVESGTADAAIGLPDLGYNIYPIYTSFGGYIFGRDNAGNYTADDIGMDNEGMIAGLSWVQMLIDEGLVSENIDWEAAHVLFETGRTPFILTGPWAITRFKEAGIPYAVSAFPAVEASGEPGAPFMGVQGLVINANSPDVLLAQAFATEVLATKDSMQTLFDQEPTPSAWTSIFESAADPDTAGFNAAGANAQPMPSIPAMGYVWDAWSNAGTLVAQGELSPTEALTSAVEQIRAQIESNQ